MIILRSVSFDHCLNKAFKNIFTVSLNKTDLENSTNQVSGKVNFPLLEVCNSFFTTPKLNLISDNMMSNKTKQVPDKQYTHLCIKTWKVMYRMQGFMQGFKGSIFCCIRFCKRKCYNFCYFSHQMCYLSDVIFYIWSLYSVIKCVHTIWKQSN